VMEYEIAEELLRKIEAALPELKRLAQDGRLDGDFWPDVAEAADLLVALVEAHEQ